MFIIMQAEPGLLEDSSSEDSESDYSGLESEPDTTDEVLPESDQHYFYRMIEILGSVRCGST